MTNEQLLKLQELVAKRIKRDYSIPEFPIEEMLSVRLFGMISDENKQALFDELFAEEKAQIEARKQFYADKETETETELSEFNNLSK